MAKKIRIITDTGADNLDQLIALGVDYVPLYITFDGENYIKQMVDISIEEFYQKISEEHTFHPKTSLPSVTDYIDMFNKHLADDEDIIYIALDSKFSGSYQASLTARDIILEENKDARIEIIDSLAVTYAQFALVREAATMANNGSTVDEIVERINKMIPTTRVFLTVENLDSLKESGRVSNISAALAGVLNIKPIMKLEDGVLEATSKVKGINKALSKIINDAKDHLGDNIDKYKIAIVHANREQDAINYSLSVKEELGIEEIEFCSLGVCIGLHAGPTLLGIALVQDKF